MTSPEAARNDPGARLAQIAASLSLVVALTLIIAKVIGVALSGSVGLLASLADSSLDLLASAIAFFGVRWAANPADANHRYGHAKAEAIAALAQAVIISVSALLILREALARMVDPTPLSHAGVAIGVMVLSIVLTAGLAAFQTYALRKSGSLAIEADRAHYIGDLASNAGVLLAIGAAHYLGWIRADALAALSVTAFLVLSAFSIVRKSLPQLMDEEMDADDRRRILSVAEAHPAARGVHALRTRKAGNEAFIQFHLELDPSLSLLEAHQVSDEIERQLHLEFERADITIHQDPHGQDESHDAFGRTATA